MHLHSTVVRILRKILIPMWQTLCPTSVPLHWLFWHQLQLDVRSRLLASFRVRDRKYLSVGLIFRVSEDTPMAFRGNSVQLKLLNYLMDFSQGQNCWR